jgi:2-C-methyl-D-erythritol 2,4-cyclodiphosphate synthase
MRAGIGFDAHAFDMSRPLVLGGITIPGATGLAGHSDADVVCHAIADALLGAANLGDLGTHFPNTAEWKDASSIEILIRVQRMLDKRGFQISSIDATVLLQEPKIGPYRTEMSKKIALALDVDPGIVSVKASTTDRLGTVGRGEGAACMAVALVDAR